jgi:hypothetical protein
MVMISNRKQGPQERKFHVGDQVSFLWGVKRARGVIIEYLGPIGMRGRRLYLVEMPMKYTEPFRLELPAEEMELERANHG